MLIAASSDSPSKSTTGNDNHMGIMPTRAVDDPVACFSSGAGRCEVCVDYPAPICDSSSRLAGVHVSLTNIINSRHALSDNSHSVRRMFLTAWVGYGGPTDIGAIPFMPFVSAASSCSVYEVLSMDSISAIILGTVCFNLLALAMRSDLQDAC